MTQIKFTLKCPQCGGTRFKAALQEAMRLAADVNAYLSRQEPWKLMSSDRARAGTVLNVTLQSVSDLFAR